MKFITGFFLICSICLTNMLASENPILFPDIKDWTKKETAVYSPHNLYEPINGAADMFLAYNFEEMQSTSYEKGENYIRVEVYRHKTPIDAFGAYSQEKPDKDIYVSIGVQGYKEVDYFNFVAGKYYIKIRAWKVNKASLKAMDEIAKKQSSTLNGDAKYPELFGYFPKENRVQYSEKYINEFILGYKFLHSSFEVKYSSENDKYVLFVLKGDNEEDARTMLTNYLAKQNQADEQIQDKFYTINDKYNGTIYILKSGKHLICSNGSISEDLSKKLLEGISKQIGSD